MRNSYSTATIVANHSFMYNHSSNRSNSLINTYNSSSSSSYHTSRCNRFGFDEFSDNKSADAAVSTGRAWTVADLRRKSFDDLHKLWYVLYKERNLLLSEKEKVRRVGRPIGGLEEHRYTKVKRSMAAIKHVLSERQKINNLLNAQKEIETPSST